MNKVWIIDDDRSIRWVLEKALEREGIDFNSFTNISDVLKMLQNEVPQVVLTDIRMPGGTGLELMAKLKEEYPNIPVIIMTAYSDLESAVASFQGGAFEYLPKPFDIAHAIELVQRALAESISSNENAELLPKLPELLGQAPAMQELFRAIGRLSQSNATVLVTGESGTGKELVARALHKHSIRANQMFLAINTAAIPKDLLESELFGHEKGSFTGAQTLRRGRFEQAENGSLFLDEIGDMSVELQTRLLRVLSDGYFYRVGGQQPIKSTVRIIAATHQNLEQRVKDGLFREDLFHRLNVIRLRIPPLRERREDIQLLMKYFLQKFALELNTEPKRPSQQLLEYVSTLDFPGNVRQLENLCHFLTVMTPTQVVEIADLPIDLRPLNHQANYKISHDISDIKLEKQENINSNYHESNLAEEKTTHSHTWQELLALETQQKLKAGQQEIMQDLTQQFEKTLIQEALAFTNGRKVEASQVLGLGRNTLTKKIQELDIK